MNIDKKKVFPALVFVFTLAWIFFANASGFSLKQALFLEKYNETISTMLSQNFLLAFILFPLPFVFAALATKRMKKKIAMIYCTAAAAVATITGFIVFPVVSAHILLFVFYVLSFFVVIETADLGFKELKRFITARAVGNAVNKANIIIALGLCIVSAQIVMPDPSYVTSLEKALTSGISNQKINGIDLTEIGTNQVIQTQKQSLAVLTKNPLFEKLRTKQYPDVNAYVEAIDLLYANIDSEAYRQSVQEQVKQNQDKLFQSTDFSNAFEIAKTQFPQIKTFEEFLWLFEAILVASIFLPLANIILGPLSMFFAAIFDKLLPSENTQETQ